jgi:RNA polymerase sigma-70 factor (ECF subfamily)
VRTREDAEDIMQETFVKTFNNLHRLKSITEPSFTSWIQTICVRSALNHLRREKRHTKGRLQNLSDLVPEPKAPNPAPDQTVQMQDHLSLIRKSYKKLPPKQRIIFDLRYYQHYAIKEIAHILRCSESNVKTQLMRSMRKLKKELNPLWRES